MKQFLFFCMVGGIGFFTDSFALFTLTHHFAIDPLIGRLFSFLIAATVTWQLNRRFTFISTGKSALVQWGYYIAATSLGGAINIAVYKVWISYAGTSAMQLIIGVGIGSVGAMLFNFLISKKLVFSN